jgi:hypothetical protein
MRTIAEQNMLLRAHTELPRGLNLATEAFQEDWNFVRTVNAQRLEKKIHTRGWNFIRTADQSLRSGVGDTSREAIASALKLALRRIGAHFNAAEVEHIELTQYPWFFLARVRVYPFRIQQGAALLAADDSSPAPDVPLPRRLPFRATALDASSGSAMPQLKQVPISSGTAQIGQQ